MARPSEAFGDPASEMCRWCESAGDGTTTILATWDMEGTT